MKAPTNIRVEAASYCNLRCPLCPTTTGKIRKGIPGAFLKFNDFVDLLNENPQLEKIELTNYGELFLNPELVEIMKYAHEKQVSLTALNGSNFNLPTKEILEALVKYRFKGILCSIDGVSPATYEKYRVRGKYERVIENIQNLNEFKKKYRHPFPLLTWQFIIFPHNQHEISEAKRIASSLGMSLKFKLSWDETKPDSLDEEKVLFETGLKVSSRKEYKKKQGKDYASSLCHQLWKEPQFNSDGKNLGCCVNFWGDFGGNIFEQSLSEVFNHPKMEYARHMLMGKVVGKKEIPCSECKYYLTRVASGRFITENELDISDK